MSQQLDADTRQVRTSTTNTPSGSQTVVQHIDPSELPSATLRLRGAAPAERRHIQWAEDVVDNEGMGKKSSKVCCIYHKPHEPGDSASEESSSSSDSDSEPDLSRPQKAGGKNGLKGGHSGHKHTRKQDSGKGRAPSPNAYERQPKHSKVSKG